MARPYLLFGQKKKHKPGREMSDQQQRQPGSGAEKHYCSVTQQSRSVPAGNELPVGPMAPKRFPPAMPSSGQLAARSLLAEARDQDWRVNMAKASLQVVSHNYATCSVNSDEPRKSVGRSSGLGDLPRILQEPWGTVQFPEEEDQVEPDLSKGALTLAIEAICVSAERQLVDFLHLSPIHYQYDMCCQDLKSQLSAEFKDSICVLYTALKCCKIDGDGARKTILTAAVISHPTSYKSVSQTFTSTLTHCEYGKQGQQLANGSLFVDYTNESAPFRDNLGEAWTVLCFDLAGSQAFPLSFSPQICIKSRAKLPIEFMRSERRRSPIPSNPRAPSLPQRADFGYSQAVAIPTGKAYTLYYTSEVSNKLDWKLWPINTI
ncbi:uncharacterized protein CLUP02_04824 [Colletotrichum lupini]|uniref:Uncharacterized protein n=1 Tax=Colletotrichum lupini TaxID=145971 RepID=A0A9Q8SLX8_9PEZI|nr:uncharacterized protein CLUP02_04824 [Colletotrichum lupini]UQC79345.1 hypothetical protein CLUP02_04824 [Colletotrichum lupini]